jgi:hypothetical protein
MISIKWNLGVDEKKVVLITRKLVPSTKPSLKNKEKDSTDM